MYAVITHTFNHDEPDQGCDCVIKLGRLCDPSQGFLDAAMHVHILVEVTAPQASTEAWQDVLLWHMMYPHTLQRAMLCSGSAAQLIH